MSNKKVLILAYDFPPYVSVGALRPFSWLKYIHEFGVYPVVITRQWDNKFGNYLDYISPGSSDEIIIENFSSGTIIRTPYKPNLANKILLKYGNDKFRFLRKAISGFYEFLQYFFIVGTKANLYFAARDYLKNNHVDIIIATGDPFVLFNYANKLSRKFNIPWIADYRDPWSQKLTTKNSFILKLFYQFVEKKNVKTAICITTVSDFFKTVIEKLNTKKNIYLIPNGYDPDSMEQIKNASQESNQFTIAYVGYIYEWHPIKSFLSVVSDFINDKGSNCIRINFYGITSNFNIQQLVDEKFPNLKKTIFIHPKIPNKELIYQLAKHNVLLLFNYYSFPGTKIYDYIGLKRLILFCYADDKEANKIKAQFYPYQHSRSTPDNFQEKMVIDSQSGIIVKDSLHLKSVLNELYEEFIKNGFVKCNTINSEKYSRKNQVKVLSDIVYKYANKS